MNVNKAISNKEITCMKCLSEHSALRTIKIPELGYGSGFDGLSTKIQLCENCYKETNSDWWEFEVIKDGYCEEYKHEKEIFEYIHTMPLAGQELIYNSFAGGSFANVNWEPQDWIDYELDILPHEKCKEYNAYSPEERQAYKCIGRNVRKRKTTTE